MTNFNKNDFFKDKNELNKKYDVIASGTEGIIYKVNDNVVAKKFYSKRPIVVKQVQDIINKSNPEKILTPYDFLIEDSFVYSAFLKFFHGNSVEANVSKINFFVLIEFVKQILDDIRKISDNNVMLIDVTRSSIMYSDTDMILTDTTKYELVSYLNSDEIFRNNLITLFSDTCAFDILNTKDDFLLIKIIKNNLILKDLIRDYENYNYFFEELKKEMEEIADCNVNSIEDGIIKVKKAKKLL